MNSHFGFYTYVLFVGISKIYINNLSLGSTYALSDITNSLLNQGAPVQNGAINA